VKDHYYAFVENYVEFSAPVPFKIGSFYYESGLKKADGSTNKGAFGRAIRIIQDDEYQAIVAAGMAQINEQTVRDDSEPLINFDVERPVIQQIAERPFREAAFSRLVKEEYGSACAMTGINITNNKGITEVEAAHIKPVKFNGPDSVRNGIALCRTFHWMFDHGLISVADPGDIIMDNIVPPRIYQLINSNGKVRLPSNPMSAPHPEFLKFHRNMIYMR